ncbi:MAG: hypothetical protein IPO33_10565 [Saprospiraceae bacterium]|nr:hypothetical protein [Candidatus Brachybacter algidus]
MSRIKPNAQMVLMYALSLVLTGILTILSCKPTQDVHVASLQSVNWLQGGGPALWKVNMKILF